MSLPSSIDKEQKQTTEQQAQMDKSRAEHFAMMGQRYAEDTRKAEIMRAAYHQRMAEKYPSSEYHTKIAQAYRLKQSLK